MFQAVRIALETVRGFARRQSRIVATLALLLLVQAVSAADKKPNILFLFADDYTYEAIRAYGYTDIDTPNLDKLVKRGTSFTHAYNMGSWSGAICVASRTMLITGRSVWDANKIYDHTDKEREAGVLWPQLMAKSGYVTYFTGKWHIKADATKAFHVARNIRPGMAKDSPEGYNRPIEGKPDAWDPTDPKFGGYWQGGKHWSEVVADDAVDYLNRAKQEPQPFFMYIAFNAPHDPRQAPQEFLDRYPLDRMQVPTNYIAEYPYKDAIGCGPSLRDEKLAPFPRTEFAVKTHRREYYALITHLDQQIGRILEELKKTGQEDNTWIFFTADHGLAVGHHGLLGKQNMYDDSVRVPFIVVGPGVNKNRRVEAPIYLQDVMATSLALADAPVPDHVFFKSLLPLIRGDAKRTAYPEIYGAYLDLQRAITVDGYKLMAYPKANKLRLYNLKQDPFEMTDLSGTPKYAGKLKEVFGQLQSLQHKMGDTLDLSALAPK